MPDTERYREWMALLAASDRVLVQLVGLAVLAVVGWELLRRVRGPWHGRLRLLYLAGGLGVLTTALRGQFNTLLLMSLAALFSVAAVVLRAAWKRTARPVETKGQ